MTNQTTALFDEAVATYLAAFDRALADLTARHEQHKAQIERVFTLGEQG